MSSDDPVPGAEACFDLYLRAWGAWGTDAWTARDLEERIQPVERPSDPEGGSVDDRLALLVASGLVARDGDAYRIRCRPDDSVETWKRTLEDHVERLHGAVSDRSADVSGTLGRNGRTYLIARIEGREDTDARARAIADRFTASEGPAGVALTAPATDAGAAQAIADALCTGAFEKEISDVVTAGEGDPEFRLYLRPTER